MKILIREKLLYLFPVIILNRLPRKEYENVVYSLVLECMANQARCLLIPILESSALKVN
jgi:hypothetical protein